MDAKSIAKSDSIMNVVLKIFEDYGITFICSLLLLEGGPAHLVSFRLCSRRGPTFADWAPDLGPFVISYLLGSLEDFWWLRRGLDSEASFSMLLSYFVSETSSTLHVSLLVGCSCS